MELKHVDPVHSAPSVMRREEKRETIYAYDPTAVFHPVA
jgi:hypothetical protein